ncbi:glycosyltransferase family 1 protein [soil metagenome]
MPLTIYYPDRILNRNTGGNTTYTRMISKGVEDLGFDIGTIPSGRHPAITLARETAFGQRRRDHSIIHYSADTGPLVSTRTPSVVTIHGVASRWEKSIRSPWQERVWRTRVSAAARSCDAVISVSSSSADDVASVFEIDRSIIHVIPHGIDVEAFQSPEPLSTELAERTGDRYILFVGNLEPRKNLRALAAGYRESRLEREGVKLVVAGKPAWNSDEIVHDLSTTPGVELLGFVTDRERIALMQHCALFAFPSLYEGFGFPVLEALAAGTVVIASDRGALRDVAGPSLRFTDIDSTSISSGLLLGISNEDARANVVASGRKWARSFSWKQSYLAHAKVYESVASA